jgi:hypothetical protein
MNRAPELVYVVKLQAGSPAELIAGLIQVVAQLEAEVERVLSDAAALRTCRQVRYHAATNPCSN